MVNVCALRCIGKENREKQFHKSEFRKREREGGGYKMKDNKNDLNADVESRHAKQHFFTLTYYKKRFMCSLRFGASRILLS